MRYMIMNSLNHSLTKDLKYWSDPTSPFYVPAKLEKHKALKIRIKLMDEDAGLELKLVSCAG